MRLSQTQRRRCTSICAILGPLLAAIAAMPGVAVAQNPDQAANEAKMRAALERRLALQQAQVFREGQLPDVVIPVVPGGGRGNRQDPADSNNGGVFVRDSAVAAEKLSLAERMERASEWDTSAEVYQEVLDQYADRVLPIHNDAQGRPDRFGSVTSVVQSRLAKWPETGRAVYLARCELPARRMLESASPSNRSDLMQVVNRYFITTAGRDAAMLLIESFFDHAEFIAAASLCDRLLEEHPQIGEERPLLLTRSSLAWHLAGEDARAKLRAGELAKQHAEASGIIGGKPRNLLEVVNSVLQSPRVTRGEKSERSWPVPFGSNDHAALASETVEGTAPRIWARLESITLRPGSISPIAAANFEANGIGVNQSLDRQRDLGAMTGILPSVDGHQMFFQDNAAVYGYDLDRGEPILGWLANYPGDGAYRANGAFASPRSVQMTTTLTDRSVLAILGQPETQAGVGSDVQTPIVCLDRANGTLNWKTSLSEIKSDDESMRAARPCGSVLVVGDSVYVMARSRRNGAFEDSYLICLALEDGSHRWSRHLASGNSARAYMDYNLPPSSGGDSHLAYADGRVFVSTDIGALACVNAADGSLAWLSVYPRPLPVNPQYQWQVMNSGQMLRVKPSFTGNPVIVQDGMILCLPGDAEHLFVFDSVTGELRGRVSMATASSAAGVGLEQPQKYSILVGVDGDHVVVAGTRSIALLDLAKIEGDCEFGDVLIRARAFLKPGFEDDTIRGRPFLTNKSIYVPTAWKLFRLSADANKALETYPPANDSWESRTDEEPGNVLFANDSIIVASPRHVNVYSDLSLLRKRMEMAVSADARSIQPRLRYADALFNAGQTEEAIHWIDTTLAQLTSGSLVTPGPDRDRVFEMLSQMFRRLARQQQNDPQLPALLERLGKTADTPIQQAGYQLARAFLARRSSDLPSAVDAYQKLLSEPTVATIRVRTSGGSVAIRELAMTAIEQIIKTSGPEAYQAVEAQARAMLDTVRTANDPMALLRVLDAFPNSQAGREAIALAVSGSLSDKPPAASVLRRIGASLTDPAQRAQLFEALLRIDLAQGDVDSALGRARMLAKLDPSRKISGLPPFRSQSFAPSTPAPLVAQLQRLAFEEQDRRLPDFKTPDEEPVFDVDHRVETPNMASILLPLKPRPDRLVAISRADRAVQIFEPGQARPMRSIALASVPDHAQSQWNGDALLVTTSSRVASLDTAAGTVKWTFDPQDLKSASRSTMAMMSLDPQGLLDPSPTAEKAPLIADPTAQRGAVRQQRRVRMPAQLQIDNDQASTGWMPDPIQRGRENIAYTRTAGGTVVIATSRGRIIGLDAGSGEVRWQSAFSDRAPSMIGVWDDVVVFGGNDESSSTLTAYRAEDGEQLLSQTASGPIQKRLNTFSVSPEGTLAAVHFDSIELFDLAAGTDEPIATFAGQNQNLFAYTSAQERVQFCGDKLLVLTGSAGVPQKVCMYDALTLEPVVVTDTKTNQRVERSFTPTFPDGLKPNEPSARMYVYKDRLLLRGGRGFTVSSVLVPDAATWSRILDDSSDVMNSQSPMLVRNGVLIINWPQNALGGNASSPGVEYYKREMMPEGRENSRVLALFDLKRDGAKMVDTVQPVNGGFYTIWSDGVLSFIPSRTGK